MTCATFKSIKFSGDVSYGDDFSEDDDNLSATTMSGDTTIIYNPVHYMDSCFEENPEGKILFNIET